MPPLLDPTKIVLVHEMVSRQVPEECQLWPGNIDPKGYGRLWFQGSIRLAHRVFWEVIYGPLGPLRLDHYLLNVSEACSRACVNLWHLEPVTDAENILRGHGICARQARQTHCKYGHEFTEENTYRRNGSRECWTCKRLKRKAEIQRRTLARAARRSIISEDSHG